MNRCAQDAATIAQGIQQREGWTDATMLGLVLEYVQNQDASGAFRDYLEERSEGEPRTREVHLRLAVTVPESTSDATVARALDDALDEGTAQVNAWEGWIVGQVMLACPPAPAAAIARIVNYAWASEQRDYNDAGGGGNSQQGHIFRDLRAVRAWLDSFPPTGISPAPWRPARPAGPPGP